jgi:hypothetical protein
MGLLPPVLDPYPSPVRTLALPEYSQVPLPAKTTLGQPTKGYPATTLFSILEPDP